MDFKVRALLVGTGLFLPFLFGGIGNLLGRTFAWMSEMPATSEILWSATVGGGIFGGMAGLMFLFLSVTD